MRAGETDAQMTAIRGILFDAGNTLIRVRGAVGDVYAEVAGRYGVAADGDALERAFRHAFREAKEGFVDAVSRPHSPERERAWWRSLVEQVFRATGVWAAVVPCFEDCFAELYAEFERPEHWEVFPDVLSCLDELDVRTIPAGVLSNWDSRLHAVLQGLGLHERFRFVLTSAEYGAEKPDPELFREGARRLGFPPGQVLHVGDLYRDDWLGASRAGLRAALVDREGRCPPATPCVAHLGELFGLLGG